MNSSNIDNTKINGLIIDIETQFLNIVTNENGIIIKKSFPSNKLYKEMENIFYNDLYRIIYGEKAYMKAQQNDNKYI